MKEIILFDKDGKVSMLYKDDCGCPPKRKLNVFKWVGDVLTEIFKGLFRHLDLFL